MTDESTPATEFQRRMSAPAAYADPTNIAADVQTIARPPRRSSLVDTIPPPPPPPADTNASAVVDGPPLDTPDESASTPPRSPQKKRTERRCETMFSMDAIFSRDLRITGVSKKGSSWRYHIEVLDIRNSLMPFTEAFAAPSSSSAASSPASSSVASLSAAYTLPPLVRYSVMRRYSDFRQLYLYLVDYFGPELADALPKFPDGGLFSYFRGDDPKLLQFRKEQLQRFLRALDEHDDTKWSRAFRIFLNPEIDELTTIGGATFAELVENYGRPTCTTAPPPSTSSWAYLNLARINTNSGYVSLSHVKSPEIRFKKQVSDGRGDWKRRKIERALRGEEDSELQRKKRAKNSRAKRLKLEEPQADNPSDTSDEEEDDDDGDTPKKSSTELMKLLSLDPPKET